MGNKYFKNINSILLITTTANLYKMVKIPERLYYWKYKQSRNPQTTFRSVNFLTIIDIVIYYINNFMIDLNPVVLYILFYHNF